MANDRISEAFLAAQTRDRNSKKQEEVATVLKRDLKSDSQK
jgi:hypothetical protein